jgi:hypothetical protein
VLECARAEVFSAAAGSTPCNSHTHSKRGEYVLYPRQHTLYKKSYITVRLCRFARRFASRREIWLRSCAPTESIVVMRKPALTDKDASFCVSLASLHIIMRIHTMLSLWVTRSGRSLETERMHKRTDFAFIRE